MAVILTTREGDCDICGEWSSRLQDGACPECERRYQLEQDNDWRHQQDQDERAYYD